MLTDRSPWVPGRPVRGAAAPGGTPTPRSSPRCARSSTRCGSGATSALRELTKRFDGCDPPRAARPRRRSRRRARRLDPSLRAALEFASDQILAYHESQREAEAQARAPGRPRARARGPGRPGRALRSRGPRRVPVDGADDRDPGAHRGRARDRAVRTARLRRRAIRRMRRSRPPRSPASTRCTASVARRRSRRWRTAPSRFAPVDVIVGPGNRYVAAAKREVQGIVGIESLAAESELAVIADDSTNPEWVAADLLAQAEHGPGGLAVVITWSERFADAVDAKPRARGSNATARRAEAEATLAHRVAGSCSSTARRTRSRSPTRSRPSTCSS